MITTAYKVEIDGIVQGVGFRPFIYGVAKRFGISGTVANSAKGVLLQIEGDVSLVEKFLEYITDKTNLPPLAKVETIKTKKNKPLGKKGFEITKSSSSLN